MRYPAPRTTAGYSWSARSSDTSAPASWSSATPVGFLSDEERHVPQRFNVQLREDRFYRRACEAGLFEQTGNLLEGVNPNVMLLFLAPVAPVGLAQKKG